MTPKEEQEAAQRWREGAADDARADFQTLLKRRPESGLGHEFDDRLLVALFVGAKTVGALEDVGQ